MRELLTKYNRANVRSGVHTAIIYLPVENSEDYFGAI
jgi:hypothetical protein